MFCLQAERLELIASDQGSVSPTLNVLLQWEVPAIVCRDTSTMEVLVCLVSIQSIPTHIRH